MKPHKSALLSFRVETSDLELYEWRKLIVMFYVPRNLRNSQKPDCDKQILKIGEEEIRKEVLKSVQWREFSILVARYTLKRRRVLLATLQDRKREKRRKEVMKGVQW